MSKLPVYFPVRCVSTKEDMDSLPLCSLLQVYMDNGRNGFFRREGPDCWREQNADALPGGTRVADSKFWPKKLKDGKVLLVVEGEADSPTTWRVQSLADMIAAPVGAIVEVRTVKKGPVQFPSGSMTVLSTLVAQKPAGPAGVERDGWVKVESGGWKNIANPIRVADVRYFRDMALNSLYWVVRSPLRQRGELVQSLDELTVVRPGVPVYVELEWVEGRWTSVEWVRSEQGTFNPPDFVFPVHVWQMQPLVEAGCVRWELPDQRLFTEPGGKPEVADPAILSAVKSVLSRQRFDV